MRPSGQFYSVVGALLLAAACAVEPSIGLDDEALVGGDRDLAAPATGPFQDSLRQWHRDATVQIEPGFCTGVLVAPNIVLTAAHCVHGASTGVRFGPLADSPGTMPGGPPTLDSSTIPTGTPSSPATDVGVIGCVTHPRSGITCGDGLPLGAPMQNDVAILVLDQRVDHGEFAEGTNRYHAIPASVVPQDPACPAPCSSGVPNSCCWVGTEVAHVGFGPMNGCVNPNPGNNPRPFIRRIRQQTVYLSPYVTG